MRSPLDITYDEIVNDPFICKDNPMSSLPNVDGSILLWEGRENPKNIQSPEYRVTLTKAGKIKYFKLDKRYNEWVPISFLKPRRFFRRKRDKIPAGRVRIELFSNGRVKRTVGS